LKEKVITSSNEKFLGVYRDDIKGRGVKALKEFEKGEFVIEYKGLHSFVYSKLFVKRCKFRKLD
jgi:hypothetical protein